MNTAAAWEDWSAQEGSVLPARGCAAGCADAPVGLVEDSEPVLIGRVECFRYGEVQGSYLVPVVPAVPGVPRLPVRGGGGVE